MYSNVIIDGFTISTNKRVTVCVICAKTICFNSNHKKYLCTQAGWWVEIKKKYNRKFFGNYRLILWIRKQNANILKNDQQYNLQY